jgi:flagellar biosynthetic protein FliO
MLADTELALVNSGDESADVDETEEGAAAAPPEYDYTEPEFAETRTSYPLLIVRTLAVLAVIVVAIWLIFKFLLRSRNKLVADTEMIKVLATFPLAANRLIKVIDVAGKVLILGVTDSNINLITELEDKELIDRIKLLSSQEASGKGSFKQQFFKLIGGRAFNKAGDVGYLRGYKDRISRMKKL